MRIAALLVLVGCGLKAGDVRAQDATFTGATSGDLNTPGNWSTGTVPTGTATFNAGAATTALTAAASFTVGSLQFNALG